MMQFHMMCHGHTQTGKIRWARYHKSRSPGRCYQRIYTMKRPCKSSVIPRKRHLVLVSIWCQSKMTSSLQPVFPTNARWLQSTSNSPSSRASSKTHWFKTCTGGHGGTIKIKTRTKHLSVVLRLNDRTLMDQGGSNPHYDTRTGKLPLVKQRNLSKMVKWSFSVS